MYGHNDLLTEEAKITKIKHLLPQTARRGRFFIPDDAFYAPPLDDNGLKEMLKQMAQWVGFKPTGLETVFTEDIDGSSNFNIHEGKPVIQINQKLAKNPFACSGLLAEGLLRYFIEFRKGLTLGDATEQHTITMLAVTYSGLGLVAVNSSESFFQHKFPTVYARLGLASRSRFDNYTHYVKQFATDYGLVLGSYAKYLCPWAQYRLKLPLPSNPAGYVKQTLKNKKQASQLAGTVVVIAITSITICAFSIAHRPVRLTKAQLEQFEAIHVLKKSYEACEEAVLQKQQVYDDQTDFFIERNLNGDRMRCASIRNQHNYRVDQFNDGL